VWIVIFTLVYLIPYKKISTSLEPEHALHFVRSLGLS
jgi:hypothetical protein